MNDAVSDRDPIYRQLRRWVRLCHVGVSSVAADGGKKVTRPDFVGVQLFLQSAQGFNVDLSGPELA